MLWNTHFVESSKINELITSENVTLQAVLDEEDIIQECKGQDRNIIDYLTKPEVMDEMVHLITHDPPEEQEETIRYKYPNVACELLTSDVEEITDCLASEKYLDMLYDFIQQKERSETPVEDESESDKEKNTKNTLNPLLASFFSKVFNLLLTKQTKTIFLYLKKKSDFVKTLVNHIEISAIMDVWVKLVSCTDDEELRKEMLCWLFEQGAIQELISVIDSSSEEEKHYYASLTLCDIIKKSRDHLSSLQEKAEPDPLLNNLESTEMVACLLNHILNGDKKEKVIINGILVILALMEFKKPLPIISEPNIQEISNDDGSKVINENDPNALTGLDIERMEKSMQQTVAAAKNHLKDLNDLLKDPPLKESLITTTGSLDPPLGNLRLHIVKLVVCLTRSNSHEINIELEKLEILKVLIDLFFQYSYNNILHTQIEQCIDVILSSEPTCVGDLKPKNILLAQLFEQVNIVHRILDAWEENENEESKLKGQRKGYMGHLTKIANHIIFNSENGPNCETIYEYIKNLPEDYSSKWSQFISNTLRKINELNKIEPVIIQDGLQLQSSEDQSSNCSQLPFTFDTALQQAFSDYQMQQMTNNFNDQFSFNEDEFADNDGSSIIPINITDGANFNSSLDKDSKSAEVFEQLCRRRLKTFDDNDSSDEDIWDDKDNEVAFTSCTQRKRTSSDNDSSDTTDSDENQDSFSGTSSETLGANTPGTTQSSSSDEVKMEIDNSDAWATNFDTGSSNETPMAMDIQDVWNNPSSATKDENWANFATFETDFSCQDPFNNESASFHTKESLKTSFESTEHSQSLETKIYTSSKEIVLESTQSSQSSEENQKSPTKLVQNSTSCNEDDKDCSPNSIDSSSPEKLKPKSDVNMTEDEIPEKQEIKQNGPA